MLRFDREAGAPDLTFSLRRVRAGDLSGSDAQTRIASLALRWLWAVLILKDFLALDLATGSLKPFIINQL
jgi:hypothetical protein